MPRPSGAEVRGAWELPVALPQRQGGLAIQQDGQRLGARSPAPLLGEHSQAVLQQHAAIGPAQFAALLAAGVVSFSPKPARNLVAGADQAVATS